MLLRRACLPLLLLAAALTCWQSAYRALSASPRHLPRPARASPSPPPTTLGIQFLAGTASDRPMGVLRLHLRPEWSNGSTAFALALAAASEQLSSVYRLEPGFLIQGKLAARGVHPNRVRTRAPKVMERGEVGWAGGTAGPDFFVYLGDGAASWLGNPHEGTVFAELADEESIAVAENISRLPLGGPTAPGQMHLLRRPLPLRVAPWRPPAEELPLPRILKVKGASLDAQAAACADECHALPRTELHGDVVQWGASHLTRDAAACCAACVAHARCNVWVFCASVRRCGARHGQCWLKARERVWSDTTLLVGSSADGWVAGTLEPPPEDHPSGAARAAFGAADADFALLLRRRRGGELRVRARLRRRGAPRAARRVQQMLAAPPPRGDEYRLLSMAAVPHGWGDEAVPDGLGPHERWPRGAAMLIGTFGRGGAPGGFPPAAVEPNPIPVRRGAIAWCSSGEVSADGPEFLIALADQPQLGVSLTVWADVVPADVEMLNASLQDIELRSRFAIAPIGGGEAP
ncbi:hypothetical protein AB1Y20_022535 [Prymnesium parvum]|uniref:Apple domain-containing protein n=1 Tax=Prymnesium parvum TaxID=97485 RepID=A0AB34JI95_PRYPA